jgi:hypothetical protein
MRPNKTVFIIGAGASKEVGLPIAKELIEIIAQKLNYQIKGGSLVPGGDNEIFDAIQQFAHDRASIDQYLSAAHLIRDGVLFSNSIDTFLDAHREDTKVQQLGKLGIAKAILEQEQSSSLFIEHGAFEFRNFGKVKGSWLVRLVRGLTDGVRREAIDRLFEKISFIVFNYDRCLEHFLYHALKRHYGIDDDQTRSLLETARIYHTYGAVAPLKWQDSSVGIPFGFAVNRQNLLNTSQQIRTYTEQLADQQILVKIRSEIATADALVFLGFSYHDMNMRILDPERKTIVSNVFGTAMGISGSDVEIIKGVIRRMVRIDLTEQRVRNGTDAILERLNIRSDLSCGGLIDSYSRSLFTTGLGGGS